MQPRCTVSISAQIPGPPTHSSVLAVSRREEVWAAGQKSGLLLDLQGSFVHYCQWVSMDVSQLGKAKDILSELP